jgi:ankyrin repeat protein
MKRPEMIMKSSVLFAVLLCAFTCVLKAQNQVNQPYTAITMQMIAEIDKGATTDWALVEKYLKKGASANVYTKDSACPLHHAAESGQLEIVKLLLKKGADINATDKYYLWTPLHRAAKFGKGDVAAYLIKKGAKVNAVSGRGFMPLHVAIQNQQTELVRLLIAKGSDVNARIGYGYNALQMAVEYGNIETLTLLIDKGAAMDTIAGEDRTALMTAVGQNRIDKATILLSKGANVNIKQKNGWTALDLANSDEMKNLLIAKGAKPGSEL